MSTTSSLSMSSVGTDGEPQSIEYQKQQRHQQPSNSNNHPPPKEERKLEGIFREKLNFKDNTTTTTTTTTTSINKETKKYPTTTQQKPAPSKDKAQQQQPLPQRNKIMMMKKKEFKSVPYFVLNLTNGKTKALFTVPTNYAHSMCINPVLCRCSSFQLKIDIVSRQEARFQETHQEDQQGRDTNDAAEGKDSKVAAAAAASTATTTTNTTILPPSSSTSFISTEYYSPEPEETALHIAQRLAIRMDGDGLGMNSGGGILPF